MTNTITYNGMTFTDASIMSAQISVDTALNQRTLDVDTMTAVIESSTDLTSFQQDTPVRFLRGGSQYSLWYINQITRIAPSRYSLNMMSSLGRLTQMEHRGGIYDGVDASTVIADICGTIPYFIQDAFKNVLLYGWLPYVSPSGEHGAQTGSAKDNLLKVLFALNATVRDDAEGTLRIENLSTAVSSQIGPDRIYSDNANVDYESPVTAVTLLEHQYISGGDETTLFEGTTVAGQVISFREPMGDLSATGFSITESGANYAVVSAGSGTLTGRKYIHTTREITKNIATAAIPNVVRIEDATLVGLTNSADVINRLVDCYKHRTYINVDATIDFEDAGDVIEIYDPFDNVMRQACIEKISPLVVSNTMKGSISALVGFTPWQATEFEDVHQIIIADGTWTAPNNIETGTEIQVIVIGGGDGGTHGSNGSAGTAYPASGRITSYPATISTVNGVGGAGGAGGSGGAGGKIYHTSILVNPGDTFNVIIGAGGSAGGGTGSSTTFGNINSDNGSTSSIGYSDPTTGITYGLPGADGFAGGNGGNGGSAGSNGGDGGSVASYSGGKGGTGYVKNNYLDAGYIRTGGGGGGGAAYGNSGGDGFSPPTTTYGQAEYGGNGGNATAPTEAINYGDGGNGGHGGGGGGGGPGDTEYIVSGVATDWWLNMVAGSGGSGSKGTPGNQGCVILIYRKPIIYQDYHIILTGAGTWTVPDGVTDLTVVCIGGGNGGNGGSNGASGTRQTVIGRYTAPWSFSCGAGSGGNGGAGGAGGSGGKILQQNISVEQGQTFSYSAGNAGLGASAGGTPTEGTASSFGEYSSDDGTSGSGFYDPIDRKTYGKNGTDGVAGGAGGSGGSANTSAGTSGNAGTSINEHSGGTGGSPYHAEGNWSGTGATTNWFSSGGGGGGGASGDAGGSAGSSATTVAVDGGNGGHGGTGGSAKIPAAQIDYGNGGTGGNGGGGGGGTGAIYSYVTDSRFGTATINYSPTAGTGGSGAKGGDGAPGCIILIYRGPVTE